MKGRRAVYLQRSRDSSNYLVCDSAGCFAFVYALAAGDFSQIAIKGLRLKQAIGLCIKQFNTNSHLVARFFHATLKNVRYAKLLRDLAEIARFALTVLYGSARNYFQICDPSQLCQDLISNAIGELGVIPIGTEAFKWKYGNALQN
jgi:hypothetical protein